MINITCIYKKRIYKKKKLDMNKEVMYNECR